MEQKQTYNKWFQFTVFLLSINPWKTLGSSGKFLSIKTCYLEFVCFFCIWSPRGALKQGGLPDWTCGSSVHSFPDWPRVEHYKHESVLNRTQMFYLVFFDTMLLSAHVERVGVSRMRDFFFDIRVLVFDIHLHLYSRGWKPPSPYKQSSD